MRLQSKYGDPGMKPSVLVTGGAGFIGSHAAGALAAEFNVRRGVRRIPDAVRTGGNATSGIAFVACDLDRPEQIDAALDGVAVVVHTAYAPDGAGTVRQCRALLDAMARKSVAHLVHLSSIAVYGNREGAIAESMGAQGDLSDYARGKEACETLVREWVGPLSATRRKAIMLRPGIVYGTGSTFWIDKLAQRIRCNAWGTFGSRGDGIAALIHVDELAEIIARSVGHLLLPETARSATAINVVGPERVTWNDYFSAVADRIGCAPLPALTEHQIGRRQILAIASKVCRRAGIPGLEASSLAPTRGEMQLFGQHAEYLTETARRLFGPLPEITLSEGLARTDFTHATRI